ncbi:ABC transporter permease, partial [Amycolatopsis sp. NPDC000740]
MTAPAPAPARPPLVSRKPRLTASVVFLSGIVALLVLSAVHLLQGTSHVGLGELLRAVFPGTDDDARSQAVA